MKHFFRLIIYWLLYANIFIALCAMAFTVQTYYLLHIKPEYDLLLIFNGIATFFIYMLIRVAAIKRIKVYQPDERWRFFLQHIRLMRILTIISAAACIIIFSFLKRNVQYALIIPGVISVLYGIPLKLKGKFIRLRDMSSVKIFLIALVWAYTGCVLPALNSGSEIFVKECVLLFLANFLFIFGITLPFDIKDLKIDEISAVKTIPKLLGIENTYTLSFLSLFCSGGVHFYLQRNISASEINFTVPLAISILITGVTIYLTRRKKDNFLFFGMLDGMILLQFLLIYFYRN